MSRFPLIPEAGTLIGAYFNGMPLPWDDDLDFGLLAENEDKFVALMPPQRTESEISTIVPMPLMRQIVSLRKMYWADDEVLCCRDAHDEHHIKYRCYEQRNWFYADIIVYHRYKENVVTSFYLPSTRTQRWGSHKWPKAWVLPTRNCTFANKVFSCPRDIRRILTHEYGSAVLHNTYDTYHFEDGCWVWRKNFLGKVAKSIQTNPQWMSLLWVCIGSVSVALILGAVRNHIDFFF